jgi:OOP family OmpA-OmpF porin
MKSVKLLATLSALMLLAGCNVWDIDKLRGVKDSSAGTAFSQALTTEYKSFTLFEADRMRDWPNAYIFAAKGLAAARGEEVAPENPDNWRLSQAKRAELTQARASLVSALEGGRTRLPKVAAKAQAAYDCWIEQEEEGWQLADIATCHGEFNAAMAQLVPAAPAAAKAPEPAPAPVAEQQLIIYFAWDSAKLDAEGLKIVDQAAEIAKKNGVAKISLVGHTDKSGSPDYNVRLSLRRADAVRAALVTRGVSTDRMSVTALGESQPAVQTADGVREARNRRVVVTIK